MESSDTYRVTASSQGDYTLMEKKQHDARFGLQALKPKGSIE